MYINKLHSEVKRIFHAVGIKKITILMCDIMKNFLYDIHKFGFKIAHYNLRGEFANINFLPGKLNRKIKYKTLSKNILFLEKIFANFINEYKTKNIPIGINSKKIWVLWWQGIENAPDLVKICVNSLERHNGGYEIIFLDKNNYKEYIVLPDFILEKVKKKHITITHLSDIIRMALLKKYGGIRCDATIFVNYNVFKYFDNVVLNSNFFEDKTNGSYDKWCGFFIGGCPNKLFDFVYNFFLEYHKKYDKLINYFLIDYAIHIAYSNFDDCKKYIDNISLHKDVFLLVKNFNKKYVKNEYDQLMDNGFYKLTWKLKFNVFASDGKNKYMTNYGNFLNQHTLNEKN